MKYGVIWDSKKEGPLYLCSSCDGFVGNGTIKKFSTYEAAKQAKDYYKRFRRKMRIVELECCRSCKNAGTDKCGWCRISIRPSRLVPKLPEETESAKESSETVRSDTKSVAERPTAEWILQWRGCGVEFFTCSACKRAIEVDPEAHTLKDFPYCHCGAKMEVDKYDS